MLFCCTHRSPSCLASSFYDCLLAECDKGILSKHQNLTIIGDLNSDLLNDTLPQTKLLNNLCKQMHLTQLVNGATRVFNGSASLLDIILTNRMECFRDTTSCPFGGSDHNVIATHLVARGIKTKKPHKYVKTRNFHNLDTEELILKALDADIWDDVVGFEDIDDCVSCFNQVTVSLLAHQSGIE